MWAARWLRADLLGKNKQAIPYGKHDQAKAHVAMSHAPGRLPYALFAVAHLWVGERAKLPTPPSCIIHASSLAAKQAGITRQLPARQMLTVTLKAVTRCSKTAAHGLTAD